MASNIPVIVQGNSFNLAIPLQIYIIDDDQMELQDYTPDPTDQISIQLKGSRRNYTYTPTDVTDNVCTIALGGYELADNYGVVVSVVKANGQRLRSFRTDQFFIVESSDDLTQDDIIQGLEENVIYLNSSIFVAGADGRGIESIIKTSTSGLVDTYTITYSDATTSTFAVTNGAQGEPGATIESVEKTATAGLVDTYTITMTDGNTFDFEVTNGMNGVDLGLATIVDDLTTGGATNVLSAEQGKVLNEKVTFGTIASWGSASGTGTYLAKYGWPVFKPLDVACKVTKMYFKEDYTSTLQSDTAFEVYVATLNDAKTTYTLTSKVTATLVAGESSVDLDIDLPANSSLVANFGQSNQSNFIPNRGTLSDDDAYPQGYFNLNFIAVGRTATANSTYSKNAWGVKFDYLISSDIKPFILEQSERIDALEDNVDMREVTYDRPTILLATGSSLTDTHEAYNGGAWLDMLNDMVDVVIVNTGKSGGSRQYSFQYLTQGSTIKHDITNTVGNLRPTYVMVFNTANMAGSNAVGVGALPDLEYGLNIVRTIGGQLIMGSELPMFHSGAEFDQTYTSFCRKHNILVSPYARLAEILRSDSPYTGFNDGVHEGYRGKSYALTHYDLLKILPIRKSIKMYAVRPDYQNGSPTYSQLIYDNNEERFVKFHAIKQGEGYFVGTKHVDNLDSSDYDTATGTSGGTDGTLGEGSSFTSILQRGGAVTFNNFALCEVILDRINCSKGEFKCVCSANPSAVYIATNKSSFATPMSEWTLVEHTYVTEGNFTWVKFSINRSGKDFQTYDKVRILICGSGNFTVARPSFSNYDGDLKPDIEPLRDYHIRQYGAELLAKTSCEDGWTMGGNASVQSLPTEIANYSGYNSVKSHIELASDSDYCTKSVAITQPCSKVAVRVVANLFPKIATSRTFSQMTDAQKAKYISTTPTITEFGYNFGTLRVSFGNGAVKEFTMWPGWFEYYQEVDVAPTDTSLTLKIERLLAKDGITTNSDFNVFIHNVSVQKID